jgi:type I restriction enzyme M protein
MIDKKTLSERDICTKFITPAVEKSGWNSLTQLLEEVSFTDGKIYVRGKLTARGNQKRADLFLILMIHLLKQDGRAGIVLPDGSLTGDGVKQRIRQKLLEDCNLLTIIRLPNSVFQPYATVATNLLFFDKGKPTKDIWYYEHRMPEGYKAYSKTRPIQVKEFEPIKQWWNNRKESDIAWKVNIKTIIERGYDLDIKNPTKPEEEQEYNSAQLMEMLAASFEKSQTLLNQLKRAVE